MKDMPDRVDHAVKEKTLQTMSGMSSAQIVSATSMHSKSAPGLPLGLNGHAMGFPGAACETLRPRSLHRQTGHSCVCWGCGPPSSGASGLGRPRHCHAQTTAGGVFRIYGVPKSRGGGGTPLSYTDPLLEAVDVRQIYDKFPEKKGGLKELYDKGPQTAFFLVKFWADLNSSIQDEAGAFYGVTSSYESNENMTITCSTKVCSFGKQVVEKVETEYAHYENGRFVYRIHRSPMCEYMINFIHKLKHLPEKYMMNSVLENFTILQVVSNRDTQETLLCTAYVFEVATGEHGAQHHIYRLVKD
ncbi:hypothetical protein YQE_09489, partial [Dendroctonus ponderosae]